MKGGRSRMEEEARQGGLPPSSILYPTTSFFTTLSPPMPTSALPDTLIAVRDAVRSKSVSAAELTRNTLDRIERFDGRLGAYLSVFADRALEQAEAVDAGQR